MKRFSLIALACAFALLAAPADARPPDCIVDYGGGCEGLYYDTGGGSGWLHTICDGEVISSHYGPGGC